MNMFYLPWANLKARPLSSLLAVLLTAFGVAVIAVVYTLEKQVADNFDRNLNHIDMVIGAKGSPLQLVLANVYHVDNPTGNIPLGEAAKLSRNPMIKEAIKLSYGDFYEGYRILGTEPSFFRFYDLLLAEGQSWQAPFDVVIGHNVAIKHGLNPGDLIRGTHGDITGDEHDAPYKVSGILKASGTVADNLVLTSLETVWETHGHLPGDTLHPREITAMLITFRSNLALITLPRLVNNMTNFQAALPAIEINRVLELLGVGFDAVKALALLILLLSAVSIFITMLNAMKDRKYELALMRVMGAAPGRLMLLIFLESVYLGLIGAVTGLLCSKLFTWLLSEGFENTYHYSLSVFTFTKEEILIVPAVIVLGLLASLLPAVKAYRMPIAKTLLNE